MNALLIQLKPNALLALLKIPLVLPYSLGATFVPSLGTGSSSRLLFEV